MLLNMREYASTLKEKNINISYSGPLWDDGVKGIAEMVRASLSQDELPRKVSKLIFSVFVEQVTNILMYSAEKEYYGQDNTEEVAVGMLLMGNKGKTYFMQTGNMVKNENVERIRSKIDHVNSLNKEELRQYQRERMRSENDNPESKGGGLGFIEVARRATGPIGYSFEPIDENLSYFSMYVEISTELE